MFSDFLFNLLAWMQTHIASNTFFFITSGPINIRILQVLNMADHLHVDVSTLYSLQVLSQDDHPGMFVRISIT